MTKAKKRKLVMDYDLMNEVGSTKLSKKDSFKKKKTSMALNSVFSSSEVVSCYSVVKDLEFGDIIEEIAQQAKALSISNSTKAGESMLVGQAKALDTIFGKLALLADANLSHSVDAFERLLKLAMKAQAQSRCNWEAISKIKNPVNATFVKQANIAHGHQQVNNGVQAASRTEKNENAPNELMEGHHGQRVDTRAPTETSGDDQRVETVEAIHGTKNTKRQV